MIDTEVRMRRSRFSEEQIIRLLQRAEAGETIVQICRTEGISEATFHRWRATYGGLDVAEARRLKILEDENRRLKQLVADLTLDDAALKELTRKPWYRPLPSGKRCACCARTSRFRSGGRVRWLA